MKEFKKTEFYLSSDLAILEKATSDIEMTYQD